MTNGCNGRGCHKLVKDATESVTCIDMGGNKLDTYDWFEIFRKPTRIAILLKSDLKIPGRDISEMLMT